MRRAKLTILAAYVLSLSCIATSLPAEAEGANVRATERVGTVAPTETSAQSRRRRAPTQLRVIRQRTYLPPTAVRTCDAWYEQEFRPSGAVIVPRMRCRWVAG